MRAGLGKQPGDNAWNELRIEDALHLSISPYGSGIWVVSEEDVTDHLLLPRAFIGGARDEDTRQGIHPHRVRHSRSRHYELEAKNALSPNPLVFSIGLPS
jgi:hypothetical protein